MSVLLSVRAHETVNHYHDFMLNIDVCDSVSLTPKLKELICILTLAAFHILTKVESLKRIGLENDFNSISHKYMYRHQLLAKKSWKISVYLQKSNIVHRSTSKIP